MSYIRSNYSFSSKEWCVSPLLMPKPHADTASLGMDARARWVVMHVLKVLPSPLTYKVITREDAEDVALFSIKTTVQLSLSRDTNAHTQSINGMFFIVFHNINMIFILYVKNGLYVIRFYFFCIRV